MSFVPPYKYINLISSPATFLLFQFPSLEFLHYMALGESTDRLRTREKYISFLLCEYISVTAFLPVSLVLQIFDLGDLEFCTCDASFKVFCETLFCASNLACYMDFMYPQDLRVLQSWPCCFYINPCVCLKFILITSTFVFFQESFGTYDDTI